MTLVTLKADPAAFGWVEVSLIGANGKEDGAVDLTDGTVLLPKQARVKLDATGSATVALRPTAQLTPAGTVYRATFTGSGTKEGLTFAGFTGLGPVNATSFVVDPPGALASPALGVHIAAADPHAGYVLESTLGAANGVATLGADSKIPGAQLPSLAIGETFTVASQAAMLALVAQRGDVAVRTDLDPDGFFLLTADAASVLANWVQITAPGAVTSVDGQTGAVALSATYVRFLQAAMNPDLLIVGAITRDANGAATSAPVVWPDSTPGTYTATSVSTAHPGAVDAYTITYGSPVTKTYTQSAVTRDANGAVTNRPAMAVV